MRLTLIVSKCDLWVLSSFSVARSRSTRTSIARIQIPSAQDRAVLDQISDPIVHLLRNAADHGIEPSQERLKKGKAETGSIFISVSRERSNVLISIADDGKGLGKITRDEAIAKAQEEGLDLVAINLKSEPPIAKFTDLKKLI